MQPAEHEQKRADIYRLHLEEEGDVLLINSKLRRRNLLEVELEEEEDVKINSFTQHVARTV